MAEKITGANLVLAGCDKTVLTTYENVDGKLTLSDNTYTLTNIIKDSTTVTQEDATTTNIITEQNEILKSIIAKGTRTLSLESGDIRETILVDLFGYRKDATSDELIAPIEEPEIYVKAEVYFAGGTYKAVCYKVALANSLTIESLSENIAKGVIKGQLMPIDVADYETDPEAVADLRTFSIAPVA